MFDGSILGSTRRPVRFAGVGLSFPLETRCLNILDGTDVRSPVPVFVLRALVGTRRAWQPTSRRSSTLATAGGRGCPTLSSLEMGT